MIDWPDFYLTHKGWVQRRLFKRIKCRESASEIAQEAFLKAYLSWESVPDDDDARRGWLWVIAKRTLLDVLRRRQVMTVVDDAERDAVESGETPESALLHHMEVSRLLTQLLPDRRRRSG